MTRVRSLLVLGALLPSLGLVSCGGGGGTIDNETCAFDANAQDAYQPSPPDTTGAAVGQSIPEMPHTHVNEGTRVHYDHNPPTSGCHYNLGYGKAPITAGAYTKEIAPEYWVHNLEHGYVVVLYNCPSGCAGDFDSIRQWQSKLKPDDALLQVQQANPKGGFTAYAKVLVLPFPGMDHKFAAVSWDWYDAMDKLDIGEIDRFYKNHTGHSPEGLNTP